MVVSSFLVILTMRYVLSMLQWFNALTGYYKAYYLARWGMDILLTQHAYRGWWYETAFAMSGEWLKCQSVGCGMDWHIDARFQRIDASNNPADTVCNPDTALQIQWWQSMIFPLFADAYQLSTYFVPLNPLIHYQNFPSLQHVDMYVYDNPTTWSLYWYDSRDGDFGTTHLFMWVPIWSAINGVQIKYNLLSIVPNQVGIFLIVNNPVGQWAFRFCFAAPDRNIIGQTSIIRTNASVQDTNVTLETIKTNRFPSILVQ